MQYEEFEYDYRSLPFWKRVHTRLVWLVASMFEREPLEKPWRRCR